MATLERIRRRSGLLIIVIGIAMLGFILTDLLGSGNSIFRADATVVGRVDGRTVELQEFSEIMEQQRSRIAQQNPEQARFVTTKQLADGAWDQVLREHLMGEQYEKLGFTVTGGELYERLKTNPSIRQSFTDQNGNFNEGQLQQYLNSISENRDIDPEAGKAYEQWIGFERDIKTNALRAKYNTAVEKGIYMPSNVAAEMYRRRNSQVNTRLAVLEYASVDDGEVTVEDRDLKAYYRENKDDFKTEQTASIQYVNFPISASESDLEELRRELRRYLSPQVVETRRGTDTLESFGEAENDSLYAASRSDRPVTADYYRRDNLPRGLDSTIFEQPIGHAEGPYRAGDFFVLSKVTDKKALPDSVNARHILLSFQGIEGGNQERTFEEAQALADSVENVLREDSTRFGDLARQYSDDPGSGQRGGNLGWFDERTMVKPFSNFAFRNDEGAIGTAMSQFGIHIIQILDQEGETEAVKLLNISRSIEPSNETIDSIYTTAGTLAARVEGLEDFANKAQESGYSPRPVKDLEPFDENIPGLGNNREIIKWAHNEDTEVGDIQLFNNNNESYVVVVLADFNEEGYRSFESVKEQVRPEVLKQKKADILKQRFAEAKQGNNDLNAIANAAGATVATQTVNFNSSSISGYGEEPEVVGAVTALEQNEISAPIAGNAGVFLAQVTERQPAPELPSYAEQQQQQAQSTRSLVTNQLFQSLKKDAKIDDRRAKFY